MNPSTYRALKIGDFVHNGKTGRSYRVVEVTPRGVIVGDFDCISAGASALDWRTVETPDCLPAPEPKKEYPPLFVMHRALFDAGYVKIEDKSGERWRTPRNRVGPEITFERIEFAWDTLQADTAPSARQMVNELTHAGWLFNGFVWHHRTQHLGVFSKTVNAWKKMKGIV